MTMGWRLIYDLGLGLGIVNKGHIGAFSRCRNFKHWLEGCFGLVNTKHRLFGGSTGRVESVVRAKRGRTARIGRAMPQLSEPGLPASSRTSGSGSSPCAEERQHEPIAAWPRPGSSRLASRSTEAAFADPDGHHETDTRRATRRRGSGRHLARPSGSLMWNPSRMRRMAVRSQSDMKLPSLPGGPEEYRRC